VFQVLGHMVDRFEINISSICGDPINTWIIHSQIMNWFLVQLTECSGFNEFQFNGGGNYY